MTFTLEPESIFYRATVNKASGEVTEVKHVVENAGKQSQ